VTLFVAATAWALTGCDPGAAGERPGVCDGLTAANQAAIIHVTGSTNSPGLSVTVYCDGSAVRSIGADTNNVGVTPKTYAPRSPEVLMFLSDLDAVGDVSAIAASPADPRQRECTKSVSFGTMTTITAQGKTSGDIQCITDPTREESVLVADCRVLAPWP
jgi:hypothetical protein